MSSIASQTASRVANLAASLDSLLPAADSLERDAPDQPFLQGIIEQGIFRPADSEALHFWFGRYLSIRESIWEVIDQAVVAVEHSTSDALQAEEWKHFIVAFSAACLLVRIDRLMLFRVAAHSMVQRKLNEAVPEYRIPRKQYTRIFSAYVDTRDALQIYRAMQMAKTHRATIRSFSDDADVGTLVSRLPEFESWLDPRRRKYLKWFISYLSHKWRRKGVVTLTRTLASTVEGFGRVASEIRVHDNKRVTSAIRTALSIQLRPGDILITRHDVALTNLFLPGFWPHAALYIGFEKDRHELQVTIDESKASRWSGDRCVLEALKDGVRFRSLDETLNVDNVAVLRPSLSDETIAEALGRVIQHEGKRYNFDFDFFNAESLVCTEVIYRAYDGIEGIEFPLTERAGRYSLSAEDILDYALLTGKFTCMALFGPESCEDQLVIGEPVTTLVQNSYDSIER